MTDHDHGHDRDTVVVRDGGSGIATILGIVAILAIVAVVWWFMFGPGAGTADSPAENVPEQPVPTLEVPVES